MKFILGCLAALSSLCFDLSAADPNILQLQQKRGHVLNTPARLQRALSKYGLETTASPTLLKAAAGIVDLTSAFVDVEYIGEMGIGTPPQIFHMDFDTGSADIWLPTIDCNGCGGHPLFDPKKSSTFTEGNQTWRIRYGDGSTVQGVSGQDIITLGDISYRQTIGLAKSESTDLARDMFLDGIFGLAFPNISHTGLTLTTVEHMQATGSIASAVVGVWLGRARDGGAGEVMFGNTNPDHYEGELKYVSLSSRKYWQVELTGIQINGEEMVNSSIDAVIDTGTTLIILTPELSRRIHSKIPGATYNNAYGWRMPCQMKEDSANTLVTFRLGEYEFPVPMSELVRERAAAGGELCYSGIGEARSSFIIMGDTFLRSYYSVYDYENDRIGFAPSKL